MISSILLIIKCAYDDIDLIINTILFNSTSQLNNKINRQKSQITFRYENLDLAVRKEEMPLSKNKQKKKDDDDPGKPKITVDCSS